VDLFIPAGRTHFQRERSLCLDDKSEVVVLEMHGEFLKNILRPPARVIFSMLSWVEGNISPDYELLHSPTFLIGPPRSGSTLLYQLVAYALSVSYFTNLAGRLRIQGSPSLPVFSARLAKALSLIEHHHETFESHQGYGKGWGGPHTGELWDNWFPDGYIGRGELDTECQRLIYQAVAATERIFDCPFVGKAQRHCVRIQALVEIFPNALFIQNVRDPLDTAQSIYIARTRDLPRVPHRPEDPRRAWFSVKPREYDRIKDKGLVEQVCEQVYFIEQNIAADRAIVGEDRFHFVHYEDVCQDPRRDVKRIADFLNSHGAPTRIVRPAPAFFDFSSGRKVAKDTYIAMAEYLETLYRRPMRIAGIN
jgi:hypothetical protein